MGSGLEPMIFRYPSLPEWKGGALLIWPPRLARYCGHDKYNRGVNGCENGAIPLPPHVHSLNLVVLGLIKEGLVACIAKVSEE